MGIHILNTRKHTGPRAASFVRGCRVPASPPPLTKKKPHLSFSPVCNDPSLSWRSVSDGGGRGGSCPKLTRGSRSPPSQEVRGCPAGAHADLATEAAAQVQGDSPTARHGQAHDPQHRAAHHTHCPDPNGQSCTSRRIPSLPAAGWYHGLDSTQLLLLPRQRHGQATGPQPREASLLPCSQERSSVTAWQPRVQGHA